jgi:hypothetical protein
VIAVAHVHILDEAHDHAAAAEAVDQIEYRVIVDSALDDRVDLDGREIGALGGLDTGEHLVDAAEAAAHAREDLRIQAVQAHGDAVEARGFQLRGVAREQDAVGRQRNIVDSRDAGEIADQIGEVRAQQRFAAGQPDLTHALGDEQPRQAQDLLEASRCEDLRKR